MWPVDAKAQTPVEVNTVIRFTKEGYYLIVGGAVTRQGMSVNDSVNVAITLAGGTIYLSGTPLPIIPGLGPTAVPGFPPTPTRASYP